MKQQNITKEEKGGKLKEERQRTKSIREVLYALEKHYMLLSY